MMFEEFEELVRLIERTGVDHKTACYYARLIGDTPMIDGDGKTIVRTKDGEELARLNIRW